MNRKIHTLYIVTFDSNDKMVGSGAIRIANPAPNVTANINVSTNIGETVKVYAVADDVRLVGEPNDVPPTVTDKVAVTPDAVLALATTFVMVPGMSLVVS